MGRSLRDDRRRCWLRRCPHGGVQVLELACGFSSFVAAQEDSQSESPAGPGHGPADGGQDLRGGSCLASQRPAPRTTPNVRRRALFRERATEELPWTRRQQPDGIRYCRADSAPESKGKADPSAFLGRDPVHRLAVDDGVVRVDEARVVPCAAVHQVWPSVAVRGASEIVVPVAAIEAVSAATSTLAIMG